MLWDDLEWLFPPGIWRTWLIWNKCEDPIDQSMQNSGYFKGFKYFLNFTEARAPCLNALKNSCFVFLCFLCHFSYIHAHVFMECLHVFVCVCVCALRMGCIVPCRVGVTHPAVKPVDNWHHGLTLSSLSWPKSCNKVREQGRETEGLSAT